MFSKLSLVVWLMVGLWFSARAQYASVPLVVLDADGHDLMDDMGRAWDPVDGEWVTAAHDLSVRSDLEVYVTNEVCADSIVAWSRSGTERDRRLVNDFVEEYRQRGWLLHRQAGDTYDLAEVNGIAEAIYAQYGYLVDYWCQQTDDPRGVYAVALLLHPRATARFERVLLSERVTLYDGEERACPLYYKNRLDLDDVELIHRAQSAGQRRAQAWSMGQWLTFGERFHLAGGKGQRLVVEREIEPCTFAEDRDRLCARFEGKAEALRMAHTLMDRDGSAHGGRYSLPPMAFAGRGFLATRLRQMRGDLRRDTLEAYRSAIGLTSQAVDTVLPLRWVMPDARRYYRLRHTYYLHDFTHADTMQHEACGCERQLPVLFLHWADRPAAFDCPPRRHGATDQTASFRPRVRGELQDATYTLSLSFERGSARLDLGRGANRQWMDSLISKAYDITHGDVRRTIQQVTIVGIASPEGQREANLRLSHQRSLSLSEQMLAMAGEELRHARMVIADDSIAPWTAVADLMEQLHPEAHDQAQWLREAAALASGGQPAGIDLADTLLSEALDRMRQAQVSYAYKELGETPVAQIVARYRQGGEDPGRWPAYYHYALLQPDVLSQAERVDLARRLLQARATEVRRFTTDRRPSDSYGLVLPLAANVLAVEALRQERYDPGILAPFIDRQTARANVACGIRLDPDTPAKWINLDAILYNQILMLCGVGTAEAMAEADELAGMLMTSVTTSAAFATAYHPERLAQLVRCMSQDWLHDEAMTEAVGSTHPVNHCVTCLARAYQLVEGDVTALADLPEARLWLQRCEDGLPAVLALTGDTPAVIYLQAVTSAWRAQYAPPDGRERLWQRAVERLTSLMAAMPVYVERLQGDAYVRGLYADVAARRRGMDLYLMAVERYIRRMADA